MNKIEFTLCGQKVGVPVHPAVYNKKTRVVKTHYRTNVSIEVSAKEVEKFVHEMFPMALKDNFLDASIVRNCDKGVWDIEITTAEYNEIYKLVKETVHSGTYNNIIYGDVVTAYEYPDRERIVSVQKQKDTNKQVISVRLHKHYLNYTGNHWELTVELHFQHYWQANVEEKIKTALESAGFKNGTWGRPWTSSTRLLIFRTESTDNLSICELISLNICPDDEAGTLDCTFTLANGETWSESIPISQK